MKELQKLIDICIAFKNAEFGMIEFQARLETVYLPDECKHTLEKAQHNASNQLEEILFCYGEMEKDHADFVAETLLQAALCERIRLLGNEH